MEKFDSFPMFLTEDELVEFWKQYFQEHPQNEKQHIQLYIHYPWCRQICKFCVFGQCKYADYKDIIPDYEQAMIRQLEKMNDVFFLQARPSSIYFGGGTASLWKPETMVKIADTIYCYDTIPFKEAELHPADINMDVLGIYSGRMGFDRISIGIQSFDRQSNLDQNRIPPDINLLMNIIPYLQKRETMVNIDLVALFNGDDPSNWNIFRRDLDIAADVLIPDSIFAEPNFRSKDFYRNSIEFRKILTTFLNDHPEYSITNKDALSVNYDRIIQYRDLPYELMLTAIAPSQDISRDEFIDQRKNEIIIGLGGINDFTAYSKTPDGFYINAKYLPQEKEFIYTLTKHDKFRDINPDENDLYNTRVQVGSYTIAPPRRISE